jgi:hypothetical protein
MLDALAYAMSQDALRRQRQVFESTAERSSSAPPSSLLRVRLGVARRLRAVADRIEPLGDLGETERTTMAIDRRDAA